jgi:hypothetical protein
MSIFTQSETSNSKQPPAVPPEPVWRLSVQQYHQMIQSGILTEDDPVELLEGWIVYKMPKNPPHRVATKLTRNALESLIPEGWYVDGQEPITLKDSEPEPDVVIVRGTTRDYLDRHPSASDVALVIEIADRTLERDRTFKKRLYARAKIPAYWILNLVEQQLEIYIEPIDTAEEPTYQQHKNYTQTDNIPVFIEAQKIGDLNLRDLLP